MAARFNPNPSSGRVAPLWLDRIPSARDTSLAAVVAGACALLVAFFAARHSGPTAAAELALAAAALAVVLLAPAPSLSLAPALGAIAVDVWAAGAFDPGTAALALSLAGALVAASLVRTGVRRRDAELVVAAEVVQDVNEREGLARRLTRVEERSWLASEIARATRHDYPLSIVLVRPDGGDPDHEALLELADVITRELRAGDAAMRQDHVTFALVLPATPAEGARTAAERMRLAVAAAEVAGAATVSIGLAAFPRDGETAEDVTREAERALARSIALGGNRTVCASLDDDGPAGWTLAGRRPRNA